MKTADVADTSQNAADPFGADGGKVHSPSVLTQVDATSDVTPDTVTTDAHPTETIGGSSADTIPPQPSINVEEFSKPQATQESIHAEVSQPDAPETDKSIPAGEPKLILADEPVSVPTDDSITTPTDTSAEHTEIPGSEVPSPSSTPGTRQKSKSRKRVSKVLDLPAEDC